MLSNLSWVLLAFESSEFQALLFLCSKGRVPRLRASLMAETVKSLHTMWETRFDPWVGKIPGGGHGNPLQYSCLENSMDKGAWWATVHEVTESQTRLSD